MTVKGVADPRDVDFALIDYSAKPGIPGPLCVHDAINEAWTYLLGGQLDVQVGDHTPPGGGWELPAGTHGLPIGS
jgi:hypothetical protein